MQNVFVSMFEVESEGFQAITELKQNPGVENSYVSQAVLVKKENGVLKTLDAFDTGATTADDALKGSLIGMCIGILGGPLGMLLGGSYGAMTGMGLDAIDAIDNASMVEQIIKKLDDGTALIGLSDEEDESILDNKLSAYKTVTARFDAAVVAQEVEAARQMQAEMERQAREQLRKQRSEDFKAKVEEQRNKMKANFEKLKAGIKKN